MQYYTLVIIIIIPMTICIVINTIIFKYVQNSTHRIQPSVDNHDQSTKLSRRDIHLLRHMIIMFLVFIIGWGPIYFTSIIMNYIPVSTLTLRILSLLAEISLLCDIIDLFLYSHELRQYFQRTFLACCYG